MALTADGLHGPAIHDAAALARAAGAAEGMRLADARAAIRGLEAIPADLAAEAGALERLMRWARRWCPWTAVDGPRGLAMDAAGSAHLWGGEATMLAEIERALAGLGFEARLAMAPTRGAAWALARFGPARAVCGPAEVAAAIAPLPVEALRLDADTTLELRRLGLGSAGALMAVPRAALARRFRDSDPDRNPLLRLDQALGHVPEPLAPPGEPTPMRVLTRLPEPILDPARVLPDLCERLCATLEAQDLGSRRIRLTVFRVDGGTGEIAVALAAPSREPDHLLRMLTPRLERLDPGFGFDLIALQVDAAEPVTPRQTGLRREPDPAAALAGLIDRLTARLGAEAVTAPRPRASHIPERAQTCPAALAARPAAAPVRPERPLRLFDRPEPVRVMYGLPDGPPAQFIWRRRAHRVVRYAGPERIAPEWWRDRPNTRLRDYYRVEVEGGGRFWIYR
ncbi:MAG: Y-family DNA polymerase, partial [Rubrimonas sp.]